MGEGKDISGMRFGALVAIRAIDRQSYNGRVWLFQCDCGKLKEEPKTLVTSGRVKSCGCRINQKKPEKRKQRIHVGDRFGSLTVMETLGQKEGEAHYLSKVKCDCGLEFITRDTFLITKKITQCKECSMMQRTIHGMSDTYLFYAWQGMRDRCNNPKNKAYNRYGGIGIKVCKEWNDSSDAFIEWAIQNGYKKGLGLYRKNVDGDYCPENCIFTTQEDAVKFKKNTTLIHYEGELLTIAEVSAKTGIRQATIFERLKKYGWNEYDATHVIPDSKYYQSKIMRQTIVTNLENGDVKIFDSASRASKYIGKKDTYLISASYRKGKIFTIDNYLIEIKDSEKSNDPIV